MCLELITNEMAIDHDMLGALVGDAVGCNVESSFVITENESYVMMGNVEILFQYWRIQASQTIKQYLASAYE